MEIVTADNEPSIPSGVVAFIIDGDTLELRDGRRIRLLQVDAPALSECYGRDAAAALTHLAPPGSTIYLHGDPKLRRVPNESEVYAVVNGIFVQNELLKQGAAVPHHAPKGGRGIYAETFLARALVAGRKRLGMWGACPAARLDPTKGAPTGAP